MEETRLQTCKQISLETPTRCCCCFFSVCGTEAHHCVSTLLEWEESAQNISVCLGSAQLIRLLVGPLNWAGDSGEFTHSSWQLRTHGWGCTTKPSSSSPLPRATSSSSSLFLTLTTATLFVTTPLTCHWQHHSPLLPHHPHHYCHSALHLPHPLHRQL